MASKFFLGQRKAVARDFLKGCRRVLDVGCGYGEFLGLFGRAKTIGLEPDRARAGIAAKRGKARVVVADAADMPFENGAFDGVLCTEVLEHAKDYRAVIGGMARVLKPGGRALITTPNKRYEFYKNVLAVLGAWPYKFDRWLSEAELADAMKRSGFEILSIEGMLPVNLLGMEKPLSKVFRETLVIKAIRARGRVRRIRKSRGR